MILGELTRKVLSECELHRAADSILSYAGTILPYKGAAIYLAWKRCYEIEAIASDRMDSGAVDAGKRAAFRVVSTGSPLAACGGEFMPRGRPAGRGSVAGRIICLPIRSRGRVLGCYLTHWDPGHDVTEDLSRKLDLVADMAAIAACHHRIAVTNTRLVSRLIGMNMRIRRASHLVSIGESTSEIVHELANSLTSIAGYRDILKIVKDGREREKCLGRLLDTVDRCSRTAESILEFARGITDRKQRRDLRKIIENVLKFHAGPFDRDGITVRCTLPSTALKVLVDDFQLQQAVFNIVKNAHHELRSAATRTFSIKGMLKGGHAIVEFSDTGRGIPKENMGRIFEPFFTTRPAGEGTGLGLCVARKIVQAHGGRLWAKSRAGQGATFVLQIPLFEG
ncbi:MAG: ATP-binding protein [bacterium]|nr:ATP-binding protein [bacterium]